MRESGGVREPAAGRPAERLAGQRASATRRSRATPRRSASTSARRSRSRSRRRRPTTTSTSCASGITAATARARSPSNIKPTATLPQTQPACQTFSSTGLIDCGNWSVSASWTVPSTAVSGVYIAHLVRDDAQDPGGESQIPFVVRNDSSHSDIVVATSDATWQAYNAYGGNSLYTCTVACPPGNPLAYKAAYSVSYNRPFDGAFTTDGGASYLWYAEYQMIHFLGGERLRRQLRQRLRSRLQRLAAAQPQAVHLERPRRVLVGQRGRQRQGGARRRASTSRSSAATRSSGRRGGVPARTARILPTGR